MPGVEMLMVMMRRFFARKIRKNKALVSLKFNGFC